MRWVVELPAPSGGTAATVTVDADSWAGALTRARGGTAIKKFKCDFEGDGVVRVLDLESRNRFTIRPLRASDSARPPGGETPAGAGPSAVEAPKATEAAAAPSTAPPAALSEPLPPSTLLFERDEEPGPTMPLVYRERVYAMPAGTSVLQAEQLARNTLASLRRALATRPRGRYVTIAVFDHEFSSRPESPPVVVLRWKDWRGEPELQVRPALPARLTSTPAVAPETVNGTVLTVVSSAPSPTVVQEEASIVVDEGTAATSALAPVASTSAAPPVAEEPRPAAAPEAASPAPSPEPPAVEAAPAPQAAPPVEVAPTTQAAPPVEVAPATQAEPATQAAPAPETAPAPAGGSVVAALTPAPSPTAEADAATSTSESLADPSEEGREADDEEAPVTAAADESPRDERKGKKKKRGRNRTPVAEPPAATPSLVTTVRADTASTQATARREATATAAAAPVTTGPFKRGKDLLGDLFDALMELPYLPDAPQLYQFVTRLLHENIAASVVMVWHYDIDKDEFVVASATGAEHLVGQHRGARGGSVGQVVRRRQSVSLAACEAIDAIDAPYAGAPVTFSGAFHQGRIFALVALARAPGAKVFESDECDAVTYVAGQLGEELSRHALSAAAREYAAESPARRK